MFVLFAWSMVLCVGAGMALLLAAPDIALIGFGHRLLTGQIHLLTLGGLLTGYYLAQLRMWPRLYGSAAVWRWPLPVIWFFHIPGLLTFLWGLFTQDALIAYWGGHYMIPTGIVASLVHGLRAARRRIPGSPRLLAAHMPGLGLVGVMSLGSLLVMDARTAQYAIYTPDTIFMHLLVGGFLFVVPFLLLPTALPRGDARAGFTPDAREADTPIPGGSNFNAPLARWYALAALGGGGVFLVALALAPEGSPGLLPLGLALPGTMMVWLGSPGRRGKHLWPDVPRRVARWVMGLLLLYVAIRLWRGAEPGELLHWSRLGVLFFLCGFALPEISVMNIHIGSSRITAGNSSPPHDRTSIPTPIPTSVTWPWAVLVGGALLLLLGQHLGSPIGVRAGAAVWLAGWAWMSAGLIRSTTARQEGP